MPTNGDRRETARRIEQIAGDPALEAAAIETGLSPAAARRFVGALAGALRARSKGSRSSSGDEKAGALARGVREKGGPIGRAVAHSDGGSRGNPGQAACAAILYDADGAELLRRHRLLGRATNNVAEYEGVILALEMAAALGIRRLDLRVDSELVVRQLGGTYKVKSPDLKPLFEKARRLSLAFERFGVAHVRREKNREADALVNAALDGKAE